MRLFQGPSESQRKRKGIVPMRPPVSGRRLCARMKWANADGKRRRLRRATSAWNGRLGPHGPLWLPFGYSGGVGGDWDAVERCGVARFPARKVRGSPGRPVVVVSGARAAHVGAMGGEPGGQRDPRARTSRPASADAALGRRRLPSDLGSQQALCGQGIPGGRGPSKLVGGGAAARTGCQPGRGLLPGCEALQHGHGCPRPVARHHCQHH
eukprot:scaffold614_cov255-Pinguiococcus_pyrenoidosus.AAC.5